LRARADEQPAVERDEHGRREHGGDDRLETVCRRPCVVIEMRDQLAGPLAAEEAHREPEQMAEQVALQRGRCTHPDPEREEVVAEIDPALEEPRGDVDAAEDEDGPEAILDGGDPEPPEDGSAEIAERQPRGPVAARRAHGRSEGEIENRRHEDGEERGERGGDVTGDEEERDRPPVGRRVGAEQPEELAQVAGAFHVRLAPPSAESGRRSVRSFSRGKPRRVSSAMSGSGRSNVAMTIASSSASAASAIGRTGRPRKNPPSSRSKTANGSSPNSFSVTYASSAASPGR